MSFKSIVIEKTRKELSALSGLIFFNDLLNRLCFMGELGKILPRMQRFRGLAAKNKFKTAILAFIANPLGRLFRNFGEIKKPRFREASLYKLGTPKGYLVTGKNCL